MSFKLSLEIGYYDLATYAIVRRLDAAFVQQVIVQAGGLLEEEPRGAAPQGRAPLGTGSDGERAWLAHFGIPR